MREMQSKATVNRRTLLQSVSATGIGLAGMTQTASADRTTQENTSIERTAIDKSVNFAEVRLTHEISLPKEPNCQYPTLTVNEFSTCHSVDRSQSTLYLNDTQDIGFNIPNHEMVIASDGYSSPAVNLGGSSPSAITTGLQGGRVISALSIKNNGYRQPKISVDNNGKELSVAAERQETTVPDGKEKQLTLPDREVTVEVFEYTDEPPAVRDDHRPAAPPRNYYDKQLMVTPKVNVINHGNLDIVKVTASSPIHDLP